VRILVVSNFFPPHYVGGYEIACSEAVKGLKDRGHEVVVLTSTYGVGRRETAAGVCRWLRPDIRWHQQPSGQLRSVASTLKQEMVNQRALRSLVRAFAPDIVYLWNLAVISVSMAFLTQELGIPLAFQVSDFSLLSWKDDAWYSLMSSRPNRAVVRLVQRLVRIGARRFGLIVPADHIKLGHVHFLSGFLQRALLDKGLRATNPRVIHWGVDARRYQYRSEPSERTRILYAGQIVPHKGVQTVVEALKILGEAQGGELVTLTLAGGSVLPEYESKIRQMVSFLGLSRRVQFLGHVPREELPEVYAKHDIFVFPSVWDEPFGIALLEAMASGLAVVATASGGSAEILKDGTNALIFPKEDASACAERITSLMMDPDLFNRIRRAARRTVEQGFRLDAAVESTECALRDAIG